jgi:hypothetical protein
VVFRSFWCWGAVGLAAFLGALPLQAQPTAEQKSPSVWFPSTSLFAPLLADPLETSVRGSLLAASGRGFYENTHIESEVMTGERLPFLLLLRETAQTPAVTFGFEMGGITRFSVAQPSDHINTDFRVGAPVALQYDQWAARVELRHIIAHKGDDFRNRFGDGSSLTT